MLVAHFSDIHLLSLRGVRPWDLCNKRLTGAANLLLHRGGQFPMAVARALLRDVVTQAVDHTLLSGDLTNLALPAEFALVRELLAASGLSPAQLTVVPGNHDRYTAAATHADDLGRELGPHLRGDLEPLGPGAFPFARLRGELAVVALSTARPSLPLLAVGTLGAAQLAAAERLLDSAECRARFRLVVLHHSPLGSHVRWHNRLTDAAALRALLARVGAELVVHGHLHRHLRRELAGSAAPIPVIGVGSGTWLSPHDPARRAQYNLYRIEERRLIEVRVRRWDPAAAAFLDWTP